MPYVFAVLFSTCLVGIGVTCVEFGKFEIQDIIAAFLAIVGLVRSCNDIWKRKNQCSTPEMKRIMIFQKCCFMAWRKCKITSKLLRRKKMWDGFCSMIKDLMEFNDQELSNHSKTSICIMFPWETLSAKRLGNENKIEIQFRRRRKDRTMIISSSAPYFTVFKTR